MHERTIRFGVSYKLSSAFILSPTLKNKTKWGCINKAEEEASYLTSSHLASVVGHVAAECLGESPALHCV